jgi:hypothetical protein
MKAQELRIGNIVEYLVHDELAEPKSEWIENVVDLDDLKAMETSENYRPMKLNEDILLKFGFQADGPGWYWFKEENHFTKVGFAYGTNDELFEFEGIEISMKYVHQLQNLYFALTGEELTQIENL